jgi:hypothetical protein
MYLKRIKPWNSRNGPRSNLSIEWQKKEKEGWGRRQDRQPLWLGFLNAYMPTTLLHYINFKVQRVLNK